MDAQACSDVIELRGGDVIEVMPLPRTRAKPAGSASVIATTVINCLNIAVGRAARERGGPWQAWRPGQ